MTQHVIKNMVKTRQRNYRQWLIVTLGLLILTLICAYMMLALGNTNYSLTTIIRVLSKENVPGVTFVIRTLRMPRMLGGLFAGFAFGIAGCVFQTLLKNSLASPNVIGISSGSSVAALVCMLVFHISGISVSLIAVAAGLLTTLLIVLLAHIRGYTTYKLILIGIGIQAMMNAIISYLLSRSSQYDIPSALRWLSGSLSAIQQTELWMLMAAVLLFAPVIVLLNRPLRILELGDHLATSLGVNVTKTRTVLMVSAIFLISFATAVTGPIAAISFLAGPLAKRITKAGFSSELTAGFMGSLLVLGSDLIGQHLLPVSFPVGVITGLIGAPFLLFLLIRINKNGEY